MPIRALAAAVFVGFGLGLLAALLFTGSPAGHAVPRSPGGERATPSASVAEEEVTFLRERLKEIEASRARLQAENENLQAEVSALFAADQLRLDFEESALLTASILSGDVAWGRLLNASQIEYDTACLQI